MARINRDPRAERSTTRNRAFREVKKSFLIICEGKSTEPDYFNAFRLTSATVKSIGEGINTITLVRKAIRTRESLRQQGKIFDNYWVVFDKDTFPERDFNDAIKLAQDNGFMVAYSNQAFEYWFLLHFSRYKGTLDRSRYGSMLSKHLGIEYTKSRGVGAKVYNLLQHRQPQAIENSKYIYANSNQGNPARAESSTTVHKLVEELNRYI